MPYVLPFAWGSRTYIMGVLNLTPDSFSGDGLSMDLDAATAQARRFVAAGVDLLDVGGESTRPGHRTVSDEEELERAVPFIKRLVAAKVGVPISIDTSKATVAEASLRAGAQVINDVWALRDPKMIPLTASWKVPVILMHNQEGTLYRDLVPDVIAALRDRVEAAITGGVEREKIIIDPGIGFGKDGDQNLEIIDRLGELRALGLPILLGPSRKRFIGTLLNGAPPADRLEGTAAAVAVGIARGADLVRVHDVEAMTRVARVTDAIVRRREDR